MTIIDLRRRLDRIEVGRNIGAATLVGADYPITDEEADAALANWRIGVAKGEASVKNGVLWLVSPPITAEQWAERHVTEH